VAYVHFEPGASACVLHKYLRLHIELLLLLLQVHADEPHHWRGAATGGRGTAVMGEDAPKLYEPVAADVVISWCLHM
jgi:hypothetical protein